MKLLSKVLTGCVLFASLPAFGGKPASVFITAGQSNADGRELVEFLPSYLHNGCYKNLHFANVTEGTDGTFGDYKFGKRFAFCDITNYYLDQALGTDFYAIKCAYGGTSITPGATHAHLPVWYADKQWISENKAYSGNIDEGKSLTLALTDGFRQLHDETLSKLKDGYDVKAIMWHQGESDRKKAGDYYKSLSDMISFMRQEIYSVTGDKNDLTLPFILGTVPHDSKQYSAGVEEAQLKAAKEIPNVYVIDLSFAGLRGDALHFDGPWTEYVGKAMFNKLVELGLVDGGKTLALERPKVAAPTDELKVDAERQWHFATGWSDETAAQLESDSNWETFQSLGYRLGSPLKTMQQLTHNGNVVKECEGLFFKCATGNRMILNPNKFICLYNDNISMIVPKVSAGQTIAITTKAAKGERGLTTDSMEHLELVSGGKPASGKVTNVWKVKDEVKEPVDLIFHPEGGSIYVYDIEITVANL